MYFWPQSINIPIRKMKRLAVFCGSKTGKNPVYAKAAREFGQILAKNNVEIVFGGGKVGIMGIVADAALAAGGKVIGIIPEKLMDMEVGHTGLTELHVVKTMHERKAMMAMLADGFVALPGGIGTIEEIIEVYTWHQIGYHTKPCAFLNTNGYWDQLIGFIQHMVNEGFLPESQKDELLIASGPEEMLNALMNHEAKML